MSRGFFGGDPFSVVFLENGRSPGHCQERRYRTKSTLSLPFSPKWYPRYSVSININKGACVQRTKPYSNAKHWQGTGEGQGAEERERDPVICYGARSSTPSSITGSLVHLFPLLFFITVFFVPRQKLNCTHQGVHVWWLLHKD